MNKKFSRQWSEEQEINLIEMYPDSSMATMEYLIGKSRDAIKNRARKLGLERSEEYKERNKHRGVGKGSDNPEAQSVARAQQPWTDDEEKKLMAMKARRVRNREIAKSLGRTERSIINKLGMIRIEQKMKNAESSVDMDFGKIGGASHADTFSRAQRRAFIASMSACDNLEEALNNMSRMRTL